MAFLSFGAEEKWGRQIKVGVYMGWVNPKKWVGLGGYSLKK